MISEAFQQLPELTVLGSIPQWGMFLVAIVTAGKVIALVRKQNREGDQGLITLYRQEVEGLREDLKGLTTELRECEQECDAKVNSLQDQLYGMRAQRIQEQMAFFSALPPSLVNRDMQDLLSKLQNQYSKLDEDRKDAEDERQHRSEGT